MRFNYHDSQLKATMKIKDGSLRTSVSAAGSSWGQIFTLDIWHNFSCADVMYF